ncbi:restriction endonuclease subunit S [Methylobacillus sp. Pita1]|uniref:restriction endonuclease subunit S n=1 Tax=Methylobacillus sp. Pita1 TaxID=3382642 RepID=UPI0038B5F9C6
MIFAQEEQRQRLKWAFESCKNGAWGSEPDGENDVVCIRAADFNGQSGRLNDGERTLRTIESEVLDKIALRPGDLVMEKSGGGEKQLVGRTVLFGDDRPSVCSNFLARCRPAKGVDSGYLNYLMLAIYVGRGTYPHIKQSTGIQNLDLGSYLDTRVNIPDIQIQQRIARFLDEKTAQIDGLIEKKRALLDRLAEKRQALITRAVTKGLNPDAPMKPSGIDWLGDIPAHWNITNLRWITHRIKTGPFGAQLRSDEFVENEIPVINPSDISDGKIIQNIHNTITNETAKRLAAYSMRINDIIFARRGEMGRCALVVEEQDGWLCGTGCIVVTPDTNIILPRFIEILLGSNFSQEWFSLNSVGATMANLNEEILGLFPLIVPPVPDQISITQYIDQNIEYENGRADKVQQSLKLLLEYRAALITSAITGQLPELNG